MMAQRCLECKAAIKFLFGTCQGGLEYDNTSFRLRYRQYIDSPVEEQAINLI